MNVARITSVVITYGSFRVKRSQKHRRERYEKISDGIVVKAILWPRQEVIIS